MLAYVPVSMKTHNWGDLKGVRVEVGYGRLAFLFLTFLSD
jgi:hypothetical protein